MIVLDTETTGLKLPVSRLLEDQPKIIEFAAIKLDDKTLKIKDQLEFKCNPGIPLEKIIKEITGLKDEDLADQPPFSAFYLPLIDFFAGEREMVAHNVAFDSELLCFELQRIGKQIQFPWPWVHTCTAELSLQQFGHRKTLAALYEHLFGKEFKGAHRAMADTEALTQCVVEIKKRGWF